MEKTVAYIFGNDDNPGIYGTVYFTGGKREEVRISVDLHGLGDDLWGWAIFRDMLLPYYLPVLVPDNGISKTTFTTNSFTVRDTVGKRLILTKGTWLYNADRLLLEDCDLSAVIKLVLKGKCFYNER